ncbi:unnamed protein product [Mytilus edulis]|uniref:Uncharacterized protein n=1 Tax=Mytilus edulis TaxID=6550 RepID=A0A8S3RSA3_MYTED|nr:unnamed protein product [Mytilus edulis]
MSLGKNQAGVKTVQSLLAAKNLEATKINKKNHQSETNEPIQMCLRKDTVIKSDLESLVKQSDLKELVTSIVSQLLNTLKDSITAEFNSKLREKTGQLQDNVDSLNLENNLLKEKLREKEIKIKELDEKVEDCNLRSVDALKSANYNEQYSR